MKQFKILCKNKSYGYINNLIALL